MRKENIKAEMVLEVVKESYLHCFKRGDIIIIKKRNSNGIFSNRGNVNTVRLSDNANQWVEVDCLAPIKSNIQKIT